MKRILEPVSQRLIRKGALVEETYELFRNWEESISFDENCERVFSGQHSSHAWTDELRSTLRRRFRDASAAQPLIVLARAEYPINDWRYCLLLFIAAREVLYRDFALNWLFNEYESGRYQLRSEDVTPYVVAFWDENETQSKGLSDYGATRTARDLLRMAKELGVVEGAGPTKRFASIALSDELLLYACHVIAEEEGATSKVPESKLWRAVLLDPADVHAELLRLHQFRALHFEIAGSVVELKLPGETILDYAETIAA